MPMFNLSCPNDFFGETPSIAPYGTKYGNSVEFLPQS